MHVTLEIDVIKMSILICTMHYWSLFFSQYSPHNKIFPSIYNFVLLLFFAFCFLQQSICFGGLSKAWRYIRSWERVISVFWAEREIRAMKWREEMKPVLCEPQFKMSKNLTHHPLLLQCKD